MDSEKVLPNAERLNTFVDENGDELRDVFNEVVTLQGGDVVSVYLEFHDYESLLNIDMIAKCLDRYVIDEEGRNIYRAAYRGVRFGYQLAVEVYGEEFDFEAGPYIDSLVEGGDPYNRLIKDVQYYLGDNLAVADFIYSYSEELSEGRNDGHITELAAGMICMLVERSRGNQFIYEDAKHLSPADLDDQD